MAQGDVSFEHAAGFQRGEASGNVQLGRFEALYEEMFAGVIEDGVITTEERAELDRLADSLGLERARLRRLEQAMQAAYEAHHRVRIRDLSDEAAAPASLQPLEPATDQRTLALERRVKFLEGRVRELEAELEEARAHLAVEVDLSDMADEPARKAAPEDDPAELARRVRHDPRDAESLAGLWRAHERSGDLDRRWCVAHVLVHLGAANAEQRAFYDRYRGDALIRPTAALTRDAWTRLLVHPEEEPLVGDIFAAVATAVLLGRVSALRRDKALPALPPERKQDPEKSTLQAVRCFSWAAAIAGMQAPPLYADPDFAGAVEMVPGVPPASRLGKQALAGRSARELAFLAGRHLSGYRAEHFLKTLLPSVPDLEDIFLGALSIGNPGLPLAAQARQRVVPLAKAIEPILDPAEIDRLRGHFLRFVEEGGRTNLGRWAQSVDRTHCRAGLLLSDDLGAARAMLAADDPAHVEERMDDLLVFATSDRYAKLRKQIGVAIGAN